MDVEPLAITKRLEALSKWHEEYRELLNSKHQEERATLRTRESNTYRTISFLYGEEPNDGTLSEETLKNDMSGVIALDETPKKTSAEQLTSGYASEHNFQFDEIISSAEDLHDPLQVVNKSESEVREGRAPRKFLRRGEGLKQRFKIEPSTFNLKNLPPYKYANAHPQLRKQPLKPVKKPTKKQVQQPKSKSPPQPLAVPQPLTLAQTMPPKLANVDAQEVRFQRLLFASKSVYNSTPDSKFSSIASASSEQTKSELQLQQVSVQGQTHSTISNECSSLGIAWSKVLDPYNIKPISVTKLREQQADETGIDTFNDTDDENLNLFELLEQKAKDGSFNLNSSLVRRILSKNFQRQPDNDEASDIVPVSTELMRAHIEPVVANCDLTSSSESESENESDSESDNEQQSENEGETEKVAPGKAINKGEEQSTLVSENQDSTANETTSKTCLRVRFVQDENSTLASETSTLLDDTGTDPKKDELFEQMKSLILAAFAKNETEAVETSLLELAPLSAEEIKKLAAQGKERVAELEKQIALFKENNMQLIKDKQQHEMEKVIFAQQQEEALEQLNDEKVRIEIQLHDERMKLEAERRKLEEKARSQKAAILSNERKEIAKLKEEINTLQTKLRDKEQNHLAAQGRLRSQLRCIEKEQKPLYDEIEKLKRENNKLEKQLTQQGREKNMTMLNEINRNIVKLAESTQNIASSKIESVPRAMITAPPRRQKKITRSEPAKALGITASSFRDMMTDKNQTSQLSESDEDIKKKDLEPSSPPPPPVKQPNTVEEKTAESPTADKDNSSGTNAMSFKVLTREIPTPDGGKEIIYPNGTIRKETGDGLIVRMMYFNGDVKETNVKEGTIKYYYAKTNTWHTTYLDGLEIIEFPNGQVEHRLPSGVTEIHYPHKNCVKIINPKDEVKEAEYIYEDGTTIFEMRNGDKLLTLPNGQKELTTKDFKRREYPDGTVKTVFPDGSHETRYSNGRLRLKDKDGNLILDTDQHRSK